MSSDHEEEEKCPKCDGPMGIFRYNADGKEYCHVCGQEMAWNELGTANPLRLVDP